MDLLNEGDKPSQQAPRAAAPANNHTPVTDTATRVEALIAALRAAGVDITADYNDWLKVGFALAGEFGEGGRGYFHDISSLYPGYDLAESDTKYTECQKSDSGRTDLSIMFYLAKIRVLPSNDPRARPERRRLHHAKNVKVTKMSLCPFPKMTPRKCRGFRCFPRPSTPPSPAC